MFESLYVECKIKCAEQTKYKYKIDLQGDMTNITMDLRRFEWDDDDYDGYKHHDLLATMGNIHLHKYSIEKYLKNFMALYLDVSSKHIYIQVKPWLLEHELLEYDGENK